MLRGFIAIALLVTLADSARADPWWRDSFQPAEQQAPADDTAEEREKEVNESLWQRTISNPLELYTAVLTLFTGILGLSTVLLWRATKRLADISERTLSELERPQVFMEVVESGVKADSLGRMSTATGKRFEYRIVNYGRTVARLVEIEIQFPIETKPAMANPIDTSQGGRKLPVGVVSAPDTPYSETENLMAVCDVDRLMVPAAWKTERLFFIGWVRYSDIFGNSYIVGFCNVFDPLGNRFVLVGDERYNYTRKE